MNGITLLAPIKDFQKRPEVSIGNPPEICIGGTSITDIEQEIFFPLPFNIAEQGRADFSEDKQTKPINNTPPDFLFHGDSELARQKLTLQYRLRPEASQDEINAAILRKKAAELSSPPNFEYPREPGSSGRSIYSPSELRNGHHL